MRAVSCARTPWIIVWEFYNRNLSQRDISTNATSCARTPPMSAGNRLSQHEISIRAFLRARSPRILAGDFWPPPFQNRIVSATHFRAPEVSRSLLQASSRNLFRTGHFYSRPNSTDHCGKLMTDTFGAGYLLFSFSVRPNSPDHGRRLPSVTWQGRTSLFAHSRAHDLPRSLRETSSRYIQSRRFPSTAFRAPDSPDRTGFHRCDAGGDVGRLLMEKILHH